MEKKKVMCNEMYQYTTTGNTLYDFIGSYINLTDFSAKSILNILRRDINLQQNIAAPVQFKSVSRAYNNDVYKKILDSMRENITANDERELLEKLRSVNPEMYNFSDLSEYIDFLQNVNFTRTSLKPFSSEQETPVLDPEIDELNTILIDTAVDKADPELVSRIRNVLIHLLLIPYARRQILKETQDEGDNTRDLKLHKIKLLDRIFSSYDLVKEYDSAIISTQNREEEAMKATKLRIDCKLTRLAALSDLTGKPVSELLEQVDSYDKSILSSISPKKEENDKPYFPQEGDYAWRLSPFKIPKLILDDTVKFSEDSDKDQEIVVVSYGDFFYARNFGTAKYEDVPLQLIGATIFGKDGNSNYFLVTPENNIVNIRNSIDLEQYKKVLFSEFVLDDATSSGYRFLPSLSLDADGIASLKYERDLSIVDSKPIDAVRYANIFKGSVGRGVPTCTLHELCNSNQLFEQQMKIINELRIRGKNNTDREDR